MDGIGRFDTHSPLEFESLSLHQVGLLTAGSQVVPKRPGVECCTMSAMVTLLRSDMTGRGLRVGEPVMSAAILNAECTALGH